MWTAPFNVISRLSGNPINWAWSHSYTRSFLAAVGVVKCLLQKGTFDVQSSVSLQLHWLFTLSLLKNKPLALESSISASLSDSQRLKGAADGFEGCHCICGPRGAALTTGGGALLHLALWVRGSWDNAAVNTPDGDLWVLWKFNVTLRATCAHWGQRWARPGKGPRLPCVGALETKCQRGGHRVLGLFCPLWHG